MNGTAEPHATWLRVWDWSPVLTTPLLTGFNPLMAALRPLRPDRLPDPHTAEHPIPLKRTIALNESDLLELAETAGPLDAAAALAATRTRAPTGTRSCCTTSSKPIRPPGPPISPRPGPFWLG
ncbi:hypothetical protein ABTY00_34405 [Streptomyces microflavus]|uniref:hypothetical protein n=1 Tax=Streptomyces microflavus TaxID=1919 RepID=UPI00332AF282